MTVVRDDAARDAPALRAMTEARDVQAQGHPER